MNNILNPFEFKALGSDNKALSGGFLYFYTDNTFLVPKSTYIDSYGVYKKCNPVVLSIDGNAFIYSPDSTLYCRLYDKEGNLQPTYPKQISVPVYNIPTLG